MNRFVLLFLLGFIFFASNLTLAHAGSSLTLNSWKHQIQNTPTPGVGCFTATYPQAWWARAPCVGNGKSAGEPFRMTIDGNGYADFVSRLCSCQYPIGSATGQVTTESGYQSESDNTYGVNSYSIQLNSNYYGLTIGSTRTQGWTQFALINNWNSNWIQLEMQWWLVGGWNSSNPCPSGWSASYPSCYRTSTTSQFSPVNPSNLPQVQLSGSATSTSDTATYCLGSTCHSVSAGDVGYLGQNNHWINTEWNVLGMANQSGAGWNQGLSLTIQVSVGIPDPESITCSTVSGYSGESSNVNLGSCSTPQSWEYQFSESVPTSHCPPVCTPSADTRTN